MKKRSLLSLTLAGALLVGTGGYGAHAFVFAQETTSVRERATTAQQSADTVAEDTAALERTLTTVRGDVADLTAARDARGDFSSHVAAAAEVIAAANGKVDPTPYRQRVLDAQNAVLAARDGSTVQEQTAAVEAAAVELAAAITEFDAAAKKAAEEAAAKAAREKQAAKSAGGTKSTGSSGGASGSGGSKSSTSGGGGGGGGGTAARVNDGVGRGGGPTSGEWWFQEMRQMINDAGGGRFALSVYDGNCGGTWAYACADYNQGILVHPDIANTPDYYRLYVARHELAHIYQYRVYNDLMNAAGYQRVFGRSIELLADCMVAQRYGGYTTYSCSGEQTSWAAGIWDGVIPG